MSSHFNQALHETSYAGRQLVIQKTGDDLCNLEKAKRLKEYIRQFKEAMPYACGTLEGLPDNAFDEFIRHVNAIDEDGELDHIIKDLEEATDEPADGPSRDHVRIV